MEKTVFFTHYKDDEDCFYSLDNAHFDNANNFIFIDRLRTNEYSECDNLFVQGLLNENSQNIVDDYGFVLSDNDHTVFGFCFRFWKKFINEVNRIKTDHIVLLVLLSALNVIEDQGEIDKVKAKILKIFDDSPDMFTLKLHGKKCILDMAYRRGIFNENPVFFFYFYYLKKRFTSRFTDDSFLLNKFVGYFGENIQRNNDKIINQAIRLYLSDLSETDKYRLLVVNIGDKIFKEWTHPFFESYIRAILGNFEFEEEEITDGFLNLFSFYRGLKVKYVNDKLIKILKIDLNDSVKDEEKYVHYAEIYKFLNDKSNVMYKFLNITMERTEFENLLAMAVEINKAYGELSKSFRSSDVEVKRAALKIETIGEMIRFYRASKYVKGKEN
jgi:hypothetical protein